MNLTIAKDIRTELVISKSRFICSLKKVKTEEEAQEFIKAVKKEFWDAILTSLLRVVTGVAVGIVSATLAAVGASKIKAIHYLFTPLNEVVKATPIVSFIFIAYIIFQKNMMGFLYVQ